MTDSPNRLSPGDAAPDFSLTDATGQQISLADLLTRGKSLILYVYPAAMTPGCTTQACDFRDSLSGLASDGFTVAGLSKDSPAKLAKFAEKDGLTFPLLSDPDLETITAYGAYGEKLNYGKRSMGVIRSTFVIDRSGKITHALYNVKAKGHVAKLRRELAAAA
jgi:thioredoxin-dependent peroxiredoxin